ncbi:MAG TPA: hypothetical protein DCQ98_03705 [Planctomycetaceae bacterium]|nr:hypothetical protein [Planctomycetaceae bacterium]
MSSNRTASGRDRARLDRTPLDDSIRVSVRRRTEPLRRLPPRGRREASFQDGTTAESPFALWRSDRQYGSTADLLRLSRLASQGTSDEFRSPTTAIRIPPRIRLVPNIVRSIPLVNAPCSSLPLALALLGNIAVAMSVAAQPIRFDAPALAPFVAVESCCDDSRVPRPFGRRLVEIELPVSHWLGAHSPESVDELLIEVTEVSGSSMVVDYWPRTRLASEYVGSIAVERTGDSQSGIKLDLDGRATGIDGALNADLSRRQAETARFERIAPQRQIVAAGTTHQGRGVAYRFRRDSEQPLEGEQRLRIRLDLPLSATNGLLRIDAVAMTVDAASDGQRRRSASERLWVALFDVADAEARAKAERLARATLELREAARSEPTGERDGSRSPLAKIERLFGSSQGDELPADWYERLLTSGERADFEQLERRLSERARASGRAYLASRRELLAASR